VKKTQLSPLHGCARVAERPYLELAKPLNPDLLIVMIVTLHKYGVSRDEIRHVPAQRVEALGPQKCSASFCPPRRHALRAEAQSAASRFSSWLGVALASVYNFVPISGGTFGPPIFLRFSLSCLAQVSICSFASLVNHRENSVMMLGKFTCCVILKYMRIGKQ
jgi:hypothetical protein